MEFNVNVVYGDDQDNIAYWFQGLHPIRPAHVDSRFPASGTGEDEWLGYIPPEDLPHCLNPAQGYLVSWNSQPTRDWEAGDYGRWGKTFHVYKPVELVEADPLIAWDELHEIHKHIARSWRHVEDSATKKDFYVSYRLAAAQEGSDPEVLEVGESLPLRGKGLTETGKLGYMLFYGVLVGSENNYVQTKRRCWPISPSLWSCLPVPDRPIRLRTLYGPRRGWIWQRRIFDLQAS